ncbi:MgtC/SapB family protein [Planktothrix sp. FACHB-1355]|uniref:MgtC/SapB family protein n=1 Tax=Aerosakkonema funiforme FACHB-1375 TaxID=2949571 RepID=A0A926VAG6_9CYAN|nr:MgtC/SapB family protein [Aerosakkonema funiforme]MBD2180238.1 MgtC/SapB family protein [Aerosakkonema funiforme FACHB-1375]MBD3559942.1 MgtC/SapB family protein [Planktothrix sp. FACHB-1355]
MTNNLSFPPDHWLTLILRLSLALLVGAIIGWERQQRHKPAGLRTHILVSFGSALFVLIPIQLSTAQNEADSIARVIQGVATGIGFLGGGEILRSSQPDSGLAEIRGLTSAAAIWVTAALGIAAGCGLWQLSLIGAALSWLILKVLKKFEPHV